MTSNGMYLHGSIRRDTRGASCPCADIENALRRGPLSEISVSFSEPMNAATVTTATFTLEGGGTPVSGAVFFNHITQKALFTPFALLAIGVTYTATITTGMTDTVGIPLTTSVSWSFTVGCSF